MSIEANAGSASDVREMSPAAAARTRPYFWSLKRELWENRSVWIAPLAAAGFILLGFAVSLLRTPHTLKGISKLTPENLIGIRFAPFGISAAGLILTTVVVGIFYCLGTLYNERRDRSILFWKSMPVSDLTALLAKITIPLVVLPIITFFVICATQAVMFGLDLAVVSSRGGIFAQLWSTVPLLRMWELMLYLLVTLTLWHAPLYGYFLALSAWVRKGPFLWAAVPPIALSLFEKLAFDTDYVSSAIHDRFFGSLGAAFNGDWGHKNTFHLPDPDPARFLTTPGLWVGLVLAVALFALAVWLRRRREPM
jgi:ABC-2 type transport system permease protein